MRQGLRAQFLECKEAWLAGQVAELEPAAAGGAPPDAYDTLKRLTDVHRTQLSDAVNQFRSVFLDDVGQVISANTLMLIQCIYESRTHHM